MASDRDKNLPGPPEEPWLLGVLRAAAGRTSNALVVADTGGTVIFGNPAAAALYGFDPVGRKAAELTEGAHVRAGGAEVSDWRPLLQRALDGEDVPDHELTIVRADGAVVNVIAGAKPVLDAEGRLVGAIAIGRDITERRRAEEALRGAYRQVEEQVRLRTEQLARTNDELRREIERRRRSEQELRASEELYRSLAEAAHDMIFIIGADDRVEYVNSFGAHQFGKTPEQLIGRLRSELFPAEVSKGQRTQIERVLATGQPIYAQTRTAFPGDARWLGTWLTPIRFADGRPHAILGVARDITDRVEAEERVRESEARYRSLYGAVSAGVLVFDRDGRVVEGNARASELLQATLEELRTLSPGVLVGAPTHEDGRAMTWEEHPVVQALRSGQIVRDRVLSVTPLSGERVWLHLTAAPLTDPRTGEVTGALTTFLDITARKHDEQFRNEYLSLISHDLRNPLAALAGRADLLARHLGKKGLDAEEKMAEGLLAGARRVTAMFQNLVDSARLEAGRMPLQKHAMELGPWLSEVIDGAIPEEEQERVRVLGGAVPPVSADPHQLERAVVNLVSNALKYSPEGSPVSVLLAREADWALIEVTDLGEGIHPDDQPRLFERFFRAGGKTAPGLGLGLYIARLVVESHGGSIAVSSRAGQGSVFTIRLPLE